MRTTRYDKILRVDEGNILKQVIVQMPEGIKVYNCVEASMDDYVELFKVEENEI